MFLCQPGDGGEDVPLKEFCIPSNESCVQSETEALIEQDPEAPPTTITQASLTQLEPARRSSSPRDGSLRRASSLDGVDGVRGEWVGPYGEPRPSSNEWQGMEKVEAGLRGVGSLIQCHRQLKDIHCCGNRTCNL